MFLRRLIGSILFVLGGFIAMLALSILPNAEAARHKEKINDLRSR